jgi:hypothetical protein
LALRKLGDDHKVEQCDAQGRFFARQGVDKDLRAVATEQADFQDQKIALEELRAAAIDDLQEEMARELLDAS